MALADIQEHIRRKAGERVKEIEKQSAKELEALSRELHKQYADERARLISDARSGAEAKLTQAKFRIREKAKAELLKSKQAVIDAVYEKALDRLGSMPDGEYEALLVDMLEPVSSLHGEISTSAERTSVLSRAVRKAGCAARVSDEVIDTVGGFVLRTTELVVDNTFETLIGRLKDETLIEVHRILFSEAS